ncbi:MAG TPA: acyltransferase [Vicinamibacterales bacterium]|nr:acyltransferase [Vicinamibacterales bacterium]
MSRLDVETQLVSATVEPTEPQVAERLLGEKTSRRLTSIDALRGIAALAVVFNHLPRDHGGQLDSTFFALLPLDFGTLGVPLFLVISGFCIHLAVARRALAGDKASVDWAAFWKRRFYRLYPPYVAAIALSVSAYFLVRTYGHVDPGERIDSLWTDLVTHLLLIHNVLPAFDESLFNPAFWTLALEEQLYALFAVVLLLRRRLPIFQVLWISLGVTLIWRWGMLVAQFALAREAGIAREAQVISIGSLPDIGSWHNWPFAFWFLWVLGAVAAEGYTRAIALPAWCYSRRLALALAAFAIPAFTKTLGRYTEFWLTDEGAQGWLRLALNMAVGVSPLAFGVIGFIVLNRWVRAEQRGEFGARWATALTSIGVFSYSLYLVHIPTLALLEMWLPLGPRADFVATIWRMLVYVPICVGVAFLFFLAVERHFLKHRKGRRTAAVVAPAPEAASITLPAEPLSTR